MKSSSARRTAVAFLCGAGLLLAQKAPQPKSAKERDAIIAVQNAQDPDGRIAAADNLITKFADTEFKSWALQMMAYSAREKNDFDKMVVYAEESLKADPKNYQSMLLEANGLAQRTREFDLDKEEKLSKAEKLANDALTTMKDAPKPNPSLPDAQWEGAKKDMSAEAHEALAQAATVRKKYDVAIAELKQASELSSQPNPIVAARLAQVYNSAGKYKEASDQVDRAMAMQNVPEQVKQFLMQQKQIAAKGQASGSAPATTPAPATTAAPKP